MPVQDQPEWPNGKPTRYPKLLPAAVAFWLAVGFVVLVILAPAHAAGIVAPNAPAANFKPAFTVATVVFETPDGRGADSHVFDGTLDVAACQSALHDIMTEWPDLTPIVGYCTPISLPPELRGALTGPTLACMRVLGLDRAKRGCV